MKVTLLQVGKLSSTVSRDSHTPSAFARLEFVETGRRRRWTHEGETPDRAGQHEWPRLITETARRHGISRRLLLTWRRLMASEVPGGFVPSVVVQEAGVVAPLPRERRGGRVEIVLVMVVG